MSDGVMNYLGFWAAVVQAIFSWPMAVVAVFFMFRRRIRELMPMLFLKRGDTEIAFRLEKAEEAAAQAGPPLEPAPDQLDEQLGHGQRIAALIKISPRAAVADMRREMDLALQHVADIYPSREKQRVSTPTPFFQMIRLSKQGVIDELTANLYRELRRAAAAATHSREEVDAELAERFAIMSEQVIARLKSIAARPVDPAWLAKHGPPQADLPLKP